MIRVSHPGRKVVLLGSTRGPEDGFEHQQAALGGPLSARRMVEIEKAVLRALGVPI